MFVLLILVKKNPITIFYLIYRLNGIIYKFLNIFHLSGVKHNIQKCLFLFYLSFIIS